VHEWKKNKQDERDSGSFVKQYQALKKPLVKVNPVTGDPIRPTMSVEVDDEDQQGW
jgi:hypothetical protein